ncbi:MAG: CDP-diacylglycerol--serine O-phosphatidyltransferase [Francisellaceae bacterium]|nr:CDP-diacylglycerol--serine O-phosphatidyltransferase [Francisellaceae bacterium]MBT6206635.1 CDP-diacylglycerol--serine O-phosphatidyltransferase [Francisellaceae bacterium]MBT6539462.1 CDP-diacylglycerol--serine O-phosphatidyltransferase [Francisellaceae bacterium]
MTKLNKSELVKAKSIYLLPNLLTTAALFSGFYAIVMSMHGVYESAAIAIFVAMIFDGLDGRVARLMGAQSEFGEQYDSLSDMVCFGLTPSLVLYSWGLSSLGKIGWLASFVYTAATCLRLARFNTQANKNDFIGIPCPAAAAVIASLVWLSADLEVPGRSLSNFAAVISVAVSLLMVSNVKFSSFKEIDIKGNVPFVSMIVVVLLFALVAWDPPKVLFVISLIYALSGPVMLLLSKVRKAKDAS